jgi:hypothetical protein
MRGNMVMYVVSIYENRRLKPAEIVLRRGEGRRMKVVNLRYTVSSYVNITTYPPVQLLYANKIVKNLKILGWTLARHWEMIFKITQMGTYIGTENTCMVINPPKIDVQVYCNSI